MKRSVYIIIAIVLVAGGVLTIQFINNQKQRAKDQHDLEAFKNLSRKEQVEKCGSCHKQEYENEKLGPHANAYAKLMEHAALVNSPDYPLKDYTTFVNKNMGMCRQCHTPVNLYEDVLKIGVQYPDSLTEYARSAPDLPTARTTEPETGIDCMNCHFDGERVVTTTKFASTNNAGCPSYCRPVASTFFTSNMNCVSCHSDQVNMSSDTIGSIKFDNTSCNSSCHNEYDKDNKFTHYTYWHNDPPQKRRDQDSWSLFSGLSFEKKDNNVAVTWKNDLMPHCQVAAPELFAKVDIYSAKDQLIATRIIRLNRKPTTDIAMKTTFEDRTVPGEVGYEMKTTGEFYSTEIPLKTSTEQPIRIELTGFHKNQNWFHDSTGVQRYYKKIIL